MGFHQQFCVQLPPPSPRRYLRVMNLSLSHGSLHLDWKLSNITPVFKSAKRTEIKNYRPIALTSIVCKILERAVADNINAHSSSNCLGNDEQHGSIYST